MTAPPIFCIPTAAAPVLAVARRGGSERYQVGRWNVEDWT
jgi:hypothetical protein